MKKVLLIVIDALATRVVKPALARGELPHLAQLVDAGRMNEECLSIFPSITPAATASIITGCHPNRHGIAGAFWYDRKREKVAYHGDDFWVIVNQGLGSFFHDFLFDLNYKRLCADTAFEHVERAGRQACVLNYMWFRGDVEHEVNAPLLLQLLPNVDFARRVKGPSICEIADFISSPDPRTGKPLTTTGGLLRRFGFHDDTTAEYLLQLADSDPLPDFTVAYFPNNDFESHRVGAVAALPVLRRIDQHIGELFDRRGGLDRLLDETAVLITGDHSQSDVEADPTVREINLSEVLSELQVASGGADWSNGDEIMACPNMRASQIYFHAQPSQGERDAVNRTLLEHRRVDQICWVVNDESVPDGWKFRIITGDRGELAFHRLSEHSDGCLRDNFGNHWSCEGELEVVDAERASDGHVQYGRYPNALERVAGSFSDVSGDLIVTARLGSEFCINESESHSGGSHGSLHALDSTAPLIAAGVPPGLESADVRRIVDVTPLCLDILGLDNVARDLRRNLMTRRN